MFGSWVLNEIWIIDLSSSLVGMLMSLSKLFLFLNEALLTVTVFVTVLCFSHHACCLLYIWPKLTVVFTFTSLPFNLYTCVLWFRIWTKILADRRIWRKKGTDQRICIPLITPLKQWWYPFHIHSTIKHSYRCKNFCGPRVCFDEWSRPLVKVNRVLLSFSHCK